MKVNGKAFRSIWSDDAERVVHIIDQTRLPFAFETLALKSLNEVANAIRSMQVRGAPLIGVAAVFGVATAMQESASDATLEESVELLNATRPTAVNLAWALDAVKEHLARQPHRRRADAAWSFARKLAEEDVATNEAIGNHGLRLIQALHEDDYRAMLGAAGLAGAEVVVTGAVEDAGEGDGCCGPTAYPGGRFVSAFVRAAKPAH